MGTFAKIITGGLLMAGLLSCEAENYTLYDGVSKEKSSFTKEELNAATDSHIRLPSGGA